VASICSHSGGEGRKRNCLRASDESDDDRGLDGTGDEDGEVDEVYDLCHACEDPNDVFEQARASAAETKANCSPVRATSAEAECSTASPQPDESDDERVRRR